MIHIRGARDEDRPEWLRMRRALWEDCPEDQQAREMEEILASGTEIAFVAERPGGRPWGRAMRRCGSPIR